jgi:hypothetical protein
VKSKRHVLFEAGRTNRENVDDMIKTYQLNCQIISIGFFPVPVVSGIHASTGKMGW